MYHPPWGTKIIIFKKSIQSAYKFENTQFYEISAPKYQNILLIWYYMFHNIEKPVYI